MRRRHRGQHGAECFGCKIQSIGLDPRATPSRMNTVAPKMGEPTNKWRGEVITDERGMPYLGKHGPITKGDRAADRHGFREMKKQLAAEAAANTTS